MEKEANYYLGLAGFIISDFREKDCEQFFDKIVKEAMTIHGKNVIIVFQLVDIGCSAIAYKIAKKHGLNTIGYSSSAVSKTNFRKRYDLCQANTKVLTGSTWGAENKKIVSACNEIAIYGTSQNLNKLASLAKRNKIVVNHKKVRPLRKKLK